MSDAALRADFGGVLVGDGLPVCIMGGINVSPESFYKGSVVTDLDELKRRAEAMVAAGAAILDIGAMSTAPYLPTEISPQEEADRLARAIAAIREVTDVPLSADTRRSLAARAALDAGATIINDVSSLADPEMGPLVAQRATGLVLMAYEQETGASQPVETVLAQFHQLLAKARSYGIEERRIVLDPGLGYFRQAAISWEQWDSAIIRHLSRLRAAGRPLLIAASRKSFIGKVLGQPDPRDRLFGSLAVAAIAVFNGAHIIRTHDVAETREVVRMAEFVRDAG